MNYYIIARRNNANKSVEYLNVLECNRHSWLTNKNKIRSFFDRNQMTNKCNTLNKYGKKSCTYYPIYVYEQENIF